MDEVRKRFLNYIQYEKRLSKNTLIAYEQDLNQFSLFLHYNFCIKYNTQIALLLTSYL